MRAGRRGLCLFPRLIVERTFIVHRAFGRQTRLFAVKSARTQFFPRALRGLRAMFGCGKKCTSFLKRLRCGATGCQ